MPAQHKIQHDFTSKKRVLSIQSHVVSGYVGNKSAVFPLQLLGFDVDVINSVHFSNHTGYPYGFEGDILKGDQLLALLHGLQRNDLLTDIGHILTGYIGSESFLLSVVDVIQTVRNNNSTATTTGSSSNDHNHNNNNNTIQKNKVRYVCDPVLGDKGKFYVPESLVQVYIEKLIPLATVVTPNQFEIEQLTGINIRTIDDAINACTIVHAIGPSLVFITSLTLEEEYNNSNNCESSTMTIVASLLRKQNEKQKQKHNQEQEQQAVWQIDCPILPGHYTGTGDVTAALFLAHTADIILEEDDGDDNDNDNDNGSRTVGSSPSPSTTTSVQPNAAENIIPIAMEKVVNTMFAMLQRTSNYSNYYNNSKTSDTKQPHQPQSTQSTQTPTPTAVMKSRELKLIQSKDIIENPPQIFHVTKIR